MALELDIQNILRLTKNSDSAKSKASKKFSEVSKKFKQLQEKIKSGESTGDKIKDYVIVTLGTLSKNAEKPYRKIEAKFRYAAGSQILIVKQDKGDYMGTIGQGCSKPSLTIIDETLILGILKSGLELDIQKGDIIFPTDKHVIKRGNYSNNKWGLKEGPISLDCCEFTYLGKYVKTGILIPPQVIITRDNPNFNHGLMLYLGEEVEKYFEKETLLGCTYLDTSYAEALNLLGHEAPGIFQEKYDEKVYQKKLGLITYLEELTRLENTREEIQTCLRQTIELGMHKEDLTIKQKPGIEINVPTYITGMCKQYKIDVPK